jgi:hypothetical protein
MTKVSERDGTSRSRNLVCSHFLPVRSFELCTNVLRYLNSVDFTKDSLFIFRFDCPAFC